MRRCVVVAVGSLTQHPHSEHLDIAQVSDGENKFQIIVGKHYEEGQIGLFFPDGALIPADMLEEMWLTGKLNGPDRNRVKARPLKGIFSEGVFYGASYGKRWNPEWKIGQDVTDELGIEFKIV